MKIDSVSNQSFKAFEFNERAIELLQRRYKTAGQCELHEKLVKSQQNNKAVKIEVEANPWRKDSLRAIISTSSKEYPFLHLYKEGWLSRLISPTKFIENMCRKANEVRNKVENAEGLRTYIDNYDKSKDFRI